MAACTEAQLVTRMLNNLKGIHASRRDYEKALTVIEMMIDVSPWDLDEVRDRGKVRLQLKDYSTALVDLETYLNFRPDAEDAEVIGRSVQYLKGLVPRGPRQGVLVVTLLVRESEVVQLLTMEDTLHAVEGAFRSQGEGTSINRARRRFHVPGKGNMQLMSGVCYYRERDGPEGVYLLSLRHPIHGPPLQRRDRRPSRHRPSRPSWQDAHGRGFRCRHQIPSQ